MSNVLLAVLALALPGFVTGQIQLLYSSNFDLLADVQEWSYSGTASGQPELNANGRLSIKTAGTATYTIAGDMSEYEWVHFNASIGGLRLEQNADTCELLVSFDNFATAGISMGSATLNNVFDEVVANVTQDSSFGTDGITFQWVATDNSGTNVDYCLLDRLTVTGSKIFTADLYVREPFTAVDADIWNYTGASASGVNFFSGDLRIFHTGYMEYHIKRDMAAIESVTVEGSIYGTRFENSDKCSLQVSFDSFDGGVNHTIVSVMAPEASASSPVSGATTFDAATTTFAATGMYVRLVNAANAQQEACALKSLSVQADRKSVV